MPNTPCDMAYLPMMIENEEIIDLTSGFSDLWDRLVLEIERGGLIRPRHNIERTAIENDIDVDLEYFDLLKIMTYFFKIKEEFSNNIRVVIGATDGIIQIRA